MEDDIFKIYYNILNQYKKNLKNKESYKRELASLKDIYSENKIWLRQNMIDKIQKRVEKLARLIARGNLCDLVVYNSHDYIKENMNIINTAIGFEEMESITKKRGALLQEFLLKMRPFFINREITTINYKKEDFLNNSSIVCLCGETSFIKDEDLFICTSCYHENIKLINTGTLGCAEKIINKTFYDRKVHFKECMNQYQSKQNVEISQKVYDDIIGRLSANRQFDAKNQRTLKQISIKHIHYYLKELGYSKYYEDAILIYTTITKKPCNDISHLEEKLLDDFEKLTDMYDKTYKNNERKNFIKNKYILYQLLRKYNHPCNKEDFVVFKTEERKEYHDNICKNLFDMLSWPYESIS